MKQRNLAWAVTDRLLIVVYGMEDPTDEEWRDYLDLVERQGVERTMHLIVTDGGEPTSPQRRWLNDLIAGRSVPVAIISANADVRGTVAALSWFNREIRAFPPAGFQDALAYLEIPTTRVGLIAREVNRLRLGLGLDELGPFDADAGGADRRARASSRLGCLLLAIVIVVVGGAAWTLTLMVGRDMPGAAP